MLIFHFNSYTQRYYFQCCCYSWNSIYITQNLILLSNPYSNSEMKVIYDQEIWSLIGGKYLFEARIESAWSYHHCNLSASTLLLNPLPGGQWGNKVMPRMWLVGMLGVTCIFRWSVAIWLECIHCANCDFHFNLVIVQVYLSKDGRSLQDNL